MKVISKKDCFFLLLAIFFLSACSKEDLEYLISKRRIAEFDLKNDLSPFNSDNPFKNTPKQPQQLEVGEKISQASLSTDGCTTKMITKVAEFDEQLLLAPGSEVIYLGSVLHSSSIFNGNYKPIIPLKKKKITFSVSIQGVQGGVLKETDATLSGYRQALNDIITQNIIGDQPSEVNFGVNQIYSEGQLRLAIGTNFSINKLADIKANFDFNSQNGKTRILAKFLQKYYTVDMDIPSDGVLVEEAPDPAKFGLYSPVYISSLTYGRMGLFFLESSHSATELKAALEAAFNMVTKQVAVNTSTSYKSILDNSSIKVYTTGGTTAVEAIGGYDGFIEFIKAGGRFGNNSRGVVLSYSLRNLSDHSIFQTKLISNYTIKECQKIQISDGQFIRNRDTDQLYIVMESALRPISSKSIADRLFHYNDSDIRHYASEQLQEQHLGAPINQNNDLIWCFLTRRYYFLEGNIFRLIPKGSIKEKYPFRYNHAFAYTYVGWRNKVGTSLR